MNDKRFASIIMRIFGIISVVFLPLGVFTLFLILEDNTSGALGSSSMLYFLLYIVFPLAYLGFTVAMLAVSKRKFNHQNYREAYIFSMAPVASFLVVLFMVGSYLEPTLLSTKDEQRVDSYQQRFISYPSVRMNSSDFICNDGRFLRTSPGISPNDSAVYINMYEQSVDSYGREFNKLRAVIGWVIDTHPKDRSITNRYFVPPNNWIKERKDFFEYIKTCITGENKSIFDEFPVVPSNIDYVMPILLQTNPEAFIQKKQ